MLNVNTNTSAINARNKLNKSTNALSRTFERLSSGLRVNSAKDDAAGLAISSRMTAQIRGLTQAVRNASDTSSLAMTAEGALNTVVNTLQRMRELSVQAASDTLNLSDRQSIQNEIDQLVSEINKVSKQVNFNGLELLSGEVLGFKGQIGADVGATIDVGINKMDAESLARQVRSTSLRGVDTELSLGDAVDPLNPRAGKLTINGVEIRATVDSDDTVSTTNQAGSAIAKAKAINDASSFTGVRAIVGPTRLDNTRALDLDGDGRLLDPQSMYVFGQDVLPGTLNDMNNLTVLPNTATAVTSGLLGVPLPQDFTGDQDIIIGLDLSREIGLRLSEFKANFGEFFNKLNSVASSSGSTVRLGFATYSDGPGTQTVDLTDITSAGAQATFQNFLDGLTPTSRNADLEELLRATHPGNAATPQGVFDTTAAGTTRQVILVGEGDAFDSPVNEIVANPFSVGAGSALSITTNIGVDGNPTAGSQFINLPDPGPDIGAFTQSSPITQADVIAPGEFTVNGVQITADPRATLTFDTLSSGNFADGDLTINGTSVGAFTLNAGTEAADLAAHLAGQGFTATVSGANVELKSTQDVSITDAGNLASTDTATLDLTALTTELNSVPDVSATLSGNQITLENSTTLSPISLNIASKHSGLGFGTGSITHNPEDRFLSTFNAAAVGTGVSLSSDGTRFRLTATSDILIDNTINSTGNDGFPQNQGIFEGNPAESILLATSQANFSFVHYGDLTPSQQIFDDMDNNTGINVSGPGQLHDGEAFPGVSMVDTLLYVATGDDLSQVDPDSHLLINGVEISDVRFDNGDSTGSLVAAINARSADTGVTASINAGRLQFNSTTGNQLEISEVNDVDLTGVVDGTYGSFMEINGVRVDNINFNNANDLKTGIDAVIAANPSLQDIELIETDLDGNGTSEILLRSKTMQAIEIEYFNTDSPSPGPFTTNLEAATGLPEGRHINISSTTFGENVAPSGDSLDDLSALTVTGTGAVQAGSIDHNDLSINGVRIDAVTFDAGDTTGSLLEAINSASHMSGVTASIDGTGQIVLNSDGFHGIDLEVTADAQALLNLSTSNNGAYLVINETVIDNVGPLTNDQELADAINTKLAAGPNSDIRAILLDLGPSGAADGTNELVLISEKGDPIEIFAHNSDTVDVESMFGLKTSVSHEAATLPIFGGDLDETNFITINGEKISGFTVLENDSDDSLVNAINAATDNTGVLASLDPRGRLSLIAEDGRNIEIKTSGNAAGVTGLMDGITGGELTLQSTSSVDIEFSVIGATDVSDALGGFKSTEYRGIGEGHGRGLLGTNTENSVQNIDVTSREGANLAIDILDLALDQITADQSQLGAVMNRLDSTINNLQVGIENTAASRSRIVDADYATESALLARNQIIQQAGTSILSQANSIPSLVLSLLQ